MGGKRNVYELHSSNKVSQPLFLITGGAGFLGINLCRYLLARDYRVRSMDIAPFDYPERTVVDVQRADIRDPVAVERAMSNADIVVHCAAALPRSSKRDIFSTDVDGTRILLESASRHGIRRFIFISSTSVYGIPKHHPIYETDPVQGVGPYGTAKIMAEQLCLKHRAAGLCVPILRPKTFVGPERLGAFELLYDWAYCGRGFPVLGSGGNLYQLLDVEDLCEVIYLCATLDASVVNDTYNVGAKEFGTMRDNVQAVLDRAGHGKRVVCVPAAPAILALKVLEWLRLSPLYEWIYQTAARDSFVSIEQLQRKLGFVPRRDNRAALMRNYDWYAANRAEFLGTTGVTHRLPWSKGALGWVKWFF
jgi:nucleoside-diphosphate-sugar epimerase